MPVSSTDPSGPASAAASGVRNAERTRRAVLDAAQRVIVQRGTKASLAEIAREAGVTKSGLMHHFRSREDLIDALVAHVVERVWEEVMAHVDLTENRPGKFTRAYVRALAGGSAFVAEAFSAAGLIAHVGLDRAATERGFETNADDPERWNRAFAADGLPPARVWAIRYGAEGLAFNAGTPYLTHEQLALARAELLALAEPSDD